MRNKLVPALGLLGVLLVRYQGDQWRVKWFFIYLFLSFVLSWWLGKKTHWSVGLATASALVSALYAAAFTTIVQDEMMAKLILENIGFQSLTAILFMIPLINVPKKTWVWLFQTYCLTASVWMWVEYFITRQIPYGPAGMASISGTMVAVTAPFVWSALGGVSRWTKIIISIFPVVSCLTSNSSMAYGVMAVVTVAYLWNRLSFWALVPAPLILGVGHLLQNRPLMSTRGRDQIWELGMSFWWKVMPHWFGAGTGTAAFWLPQALFKPDQVHQDVSIWMHNDWLQVLFEQGYVGFASVIILYFVMLKKTARNPTLLSATLGYGAAAMGQFLPHFVHSALIGVGLIALIF